MSKTDKNIAMAKECGADVYFMGGRNARPSNRRVTFAIKELDEYTSRACAEKDTLIAMQAEALGYVLGNDLELPSSVSIVNEALFATAETVEAWKNRQGDKK